VERVRYDDMSPNIYSPRAGTPASKLPDPTPRAEKQARFDRLLESANRISGELHGRLCGTDGPRPGGRG
jgi:tRNA-2-methylthio-N6-dimethylallyladenosine synthase